MKNEWTKDQQRSAENWERKNYPNFITLWKKKRQVFNLFPKTNEEDKNLLKFVVDDFGNKRFIKGEKALFYLKG